ncbi:MAG: hypothetical protein KZQ83_13570 [gamma proteobacterium symbiont of Taylorina sp.]|nr:hypothetical protein [gamma proteobacterium symbiont of Taylorina sp.]
MSRQLFLFIFITFMSLSSTVYSASIRQCRQADGTILFTNKSCSIAKRSFPVVFNNAYINKTAYRKKPPFRHSNFIRLQNKMINARTAESMEEHARTIMDSILSYTKNGQINKAYDMVASSYAKISVHLKKKQWEQQAIAEHIVKIQGLFEEVLISQPTISTAIAFNDVVQTAWENYSK